MTDQTTLTQAQALALLSGTVSVQEVRDVMASMMSSTALDLASIGAALVAGGYVRPFAPTGSPPTNIVISPLAIPEQSFGAIIGVVTVTDADLPNDTHTFVISDSRFEIVDGIFKLKDGSEVIFSNEQSVSLTVTATDRGHNSLAKAFTFTVTEQIVPPVNHAPTDVLLDTTTISDTELGAIVGNVRAVDPDLPNDTVVVTVDNDPRFVVVNDQLRLTPDQFVSHLLEPTITVTLRATDAGGLSATHAYVITVTDIAAPDLSNAYFVAPLAAGAANGSSFANAFGFTSLNSAIQLAAAASKQVLMASHLGTYTGQRITLSHGGVNGAPVIVRGVNAAGSESSITINGTRSNPWSVGGVDGPDIFKFTAGANHLFFKNINFTNCGKGCFSFTDSVSDITIDTCNGTNVRRFIENAVATPATAATVTALRVRNVLVQGYSKSCALITYDSNNQSWENVVGDSLFQDGDNFAVGIGIEGTAHNITFTDCTMRNSRDVSPNLGPPQTFFNGDGFSSETGNYDLTFMRCVSTHNTDGGFDLKSSNTSLIDCRSAMNKANYKLWRTGTALRCHGYDPYRDPLDVNAKSQIELDHTGSPDLNWTFTDCTFVDNDATNVFIEVAETGTKFLTLTNCSVQRNPDSLLIHNAAGEDTISLDIHDGPPFTVQPVISAVSTAGQLSIVTPGTVTGGVTNAFQWLQDGVYIDDAVSAGYTGVAADVGHRISCRQFTTNASGYMSEATSAESGILSASALVNLTLPVITGPLGINGILTKVPGTYTGIPQPTFTQQWKANGVDISGATGTTYTILAGDIGKTITVVETATNAAGSLVETSVGVGPVVAALSTAYVRLAGHGSQDGSSFANAVAWPSINAVMSAMAPGGIVYLLNTDTYDSVAPTITHGGTAVDALVHLSADEDGNQVPFFNAAGVRSPVTIQGVNASLVPGLATFVKSRTDWTLPFNGTLTNPFTTSAGSAVINVHVLNHGLIGSTQTVAFHGQSAVGGTSVAEATYYVPTVTGTHDFTITVAAPASTGTTGGGTVVYEVVTSTTSWNIGTEGLKLGNGADNLKLSYLDFHKCGEPGAISILAGASLTNLEIDHCNFYNVRRFLEMSTSATVTNYYIHDVVGVGFSKTAIRLRNNTSMVVVEDINLDSGRQNLDNFATGIELNTGAHDVAIRRVNIRNCHDSAGTFWNADGIAAELTNDKLLIEDSSFSGHTDGAIDSKATNTICRRVTSTDSKYTLKLWGRGLVTIDECTLSDCRKRGGSGGTLLVEAAGRTSFSDPAMDLTIKGTTFTFTGAAGTAIGDDDSSDDLNKICRQLTDTNTFTNILAGTDRMSEPNNLNLFSLSTDVVAPVITSSNTQNAYNNASTIYALTADGPCSWEIVGGADQAIFSIQDGSGNTCHIGQNLRMARQVFSGSNTRVVTIRAKDAAGNHSDQTVTVTILAAAPPYTFRCRFEGANNATTATDEGGSPHAISFSGNAKLTTTSPLEGTSSLLLDGNGDFVACSDSVDWAFSGEFSVIAKFNMDVLQNGMLASHFDSTGGSNLAWYLAVIGTELQFKYSNDGVTTFTLTSSGAALATGVTHEAAVDRDENGKIRLYLDGVMVNSVSYGASLRNAAAAMRIGAQIAVSPAYFSGRIDDVRIWKGYSFAASDSGYTP